MFTGIIEEVGTIQKIQAGGKSCVLTVSAKTILTDASLGDSIAVNGTCLTICHRDAVSFSADVMPETMRRTNLGKLHLGSPVNLERAMSANGRFGGHIVSGHIDGVGTLISAKRDDNAVWITIETSQQVLRYIVEKGSIAIDGISLTVAEIKSRCFSVSVIPHTGQQTTLLSKKNGDIVNLECDVIGKYVEKFLNQSGNSGVTVDFLAQHGFL